MLLGRLRIRGKLALFAVVPLFSMLALAVPVVHDRIAAAADAGDLAATVRIANRVGTLVQDLQQERLLSIGYLLGKVDRSQLVQKSATVADGVADLAFEFDGQLTERVRTALDDTRKLADLRTAVLSRQADTDRVMTAFSTVDNALISALRLQFDVDTSTAAGRQVLALDALLRADEGISTSASLIVLLGASRGNVAATQQISAAYVGTLAALKVDNQRFRALATPEQYRLAQLEETAVAARTSKDFLNAGALDPASAIASTPPETLFAAVSSLITLGQFVEKKVAADVIAEVTGQQRRALTEAYLVAGAVLLTLVLVVVLSLLLARTVSRPLTRLTHSADRVARLAEAELTRIADDETESAGPLRLDRVDVRSRDEIGDLARAFDRVQGTAARLVERQVVSRRNVAQMFGHVGRRTQNLVGRQISLIDRLEHRETDPGRLQHLYRLDHVTSRLRRSASSLVVLSGSTGTDGHTEPASLSNIVRLALGEIEDYTRVDVRVEPDILVAPAVVGDLVLALAELMENATSFSPPHTRVSVTGQRTANGARIRLVDHGIGLPDQRIAEENARLTRRERLDLAPTEVLGLFVVGRLARRHGWRVELSPTPGGGITVELELTGRLLQEVRPDEPTVTMPRVIEGSGAALRPDRATGGLAGAGAAAGMAGAGAEPSVGAAAGRPAIGPAGPPAEPTGPVPAPAPATAIVPESIVAAPTVPITALTAATQGSVLGASPTMELPAVTGAGPATAPGNATGNAPGTATGTAMGAAPGDATGDGSGTGTPLPADRAAGGRPGGAPTGPAFSKELVDRATRLMAGQSWNAFSPLTGHAPADPPADLRAGARTQEVDGEPATEPVRGTASVRTSRPGLRQRVPGSHLTSRGTGGQANGGQNNGARPNGGPNPDMVPAGAAGSRAGTAEAAAQADPAAVRALVEQFEDGVRRAQEDASGPDGTDDRSMLAGARSGRHIRLNRRVPGDSLEPGAVRLDRMPTPTSPADPEEARSLITEFESGVARALSEIRSERRDEEGSPE
ncbi:nitrate- and nitrite sensing domain-containing protein [Plantactinospora sp. KBS50]|uniref:nitrate- and nitrite sensing domain-containing protein n=1 Tax=Plantactinospora sp. KBS50 TaxID=2024580 RepID=UPI000BAAC82D|nr:nitrate- and nitrite sensing domain-containing protein [Plantactinospora sp. KBS50]ASW56962.1 hypothetical protein CIK06_26610 [Plantactinospora sp. KBS50]